MSWKRITFSWWVLLGGSVVVLCLTVIATQRLSERSESEWILASIKANEFVSVSSARIVIYPVSRSGFPRQETLVVTVRKGEQRRPEQVLVLCQDRSFREQLIAAVNDVLSGPIGLITRYSGPTKIVIVRLDGESFQVLERGDVWWIETQRTN
jgi:hypothetical protein